MKGFTLIETLIAVLLLSTAIVGPLTIASKGVHATTVAKDQFVAFYLAQDAMEQVRYLRDSACLTAGGGPTGCPTSSWLSNISNCVSTTGTTACYFDSIRIDITPPTICPSGVCPVMKYDTALKSFRYATGVDTPQRFVRTIKIQNDPSSSTPDEAQVLVTVSWSDTAGVTRVPVTLNETLFRWQ